MNAAITISSPAMAAHLGGCRDSHKAQGRRPANAMLTDYAGADLMAAILEADRTLAAEYGQEPYEPFPGDPAWNVASCDIAPCLAAALRKAGIRFGKDGRPEASR